MYKCFTFVSVPHACLGSVEDRRGLDPLEPEIQCGHFVTPLTCTLTYSSFSIKNIIIIKFLSISREAFYSL